MFVAFVKEVFLDGKNATSLDAPSSYTETHCRRLICTKKGRGK